MIKDTDFFKEAGVAIVTGGEGDIGKAIVETLKEIGYETVSWDIKKGMDINNTFDVKDRLSHYDKVDVLVNCAGIANGDWDKQIDINLKAPYVLCNLVFPKMKKTGGSIINITSLWSERGFKGNPAYGASKGGLKQLTKALAMDWAQYNIRVNNLGLGYFRTNMTKYSWKERRDNVTSHIPLGRWGNPEDIKEAIRFLVNSKYVTGTTVQVDGGWLAWGGI